MQHLCFEDSHLRERGKSGALQKTEIIIMVLLLLYSSLHRIHLFFFFFLLFGFKPTGKEASDIYCARILMLEEQLYGKEVHRYYINPASLTDRSDANF